MQSFSLANSLIKKLYSSEEEDGPNIATTESRQRVNSSNSRTTINEDDVTSRDTRANEDRLLIVENVEDNAAADEKVDGNYYNDNDDGKTDKECDKVRGEIESRETFTYKFGRYWFMRKFDKFYCCCCRPKRRREDFLFKEAKSKLDEEIDLLEIIKKLRVHQFASQVTLKPH